MAALTTCAFVDKASIVTEPHRYASQIAILNKDGQKRVLKLDHNPLIGNEDKMYKLEKTTIDNIRTLKALGLAFMHAKNPRMDAKSDTLEEIFVDQELMMEYI